MVQWFQKPENALKRAHELLEVGKKADALDTLHDVIKSRRHRQWTKVHEEIMMVHLRICVEIKKPLVAKDGLWQYRNIAQNVNLKSLEDVVMFYLGLAEKKAEEARAEAAALGGKASAEGGEGEEGEEGTKATGLEDAPDDLDVADSPESLLLSAVTGADAQDRADRTVLSPWLRFMWESYRQCLELLRNNQAVEHLYHKIARQALDFCAKYQRRAEFRKLCDNLRTHLSQLSKSQHSQYSVKLTNPDTITAMQETRLYQLEMAIQMELWQEAFKSCEDVHGLVLLSGEKRLLKPQAVANYYEKLALVFWKAGNELYHAAALLKLLNHFREMKKSWGGEEAKGLASRVLLACLSVAPGANNPSQLARYLDLEEMALGNIRKLGGLLELARTPTRASLLKEAARCGVLTLAGPEARELHAILEERFHPLQLAKELVAQLDKVEAAADMAQYVPVLKEQAALRVLQQVAEVYETISLQRLSEILPFLDPVHLERLAVHAAKKSHIIIRVDHRGSSLELKAGEGLAGREAGGRVAEGRSDPSAALVEEASGEAAGLQDLASKEMRNQVESLYLALQHVNATINAQAIRQQHLDTLGKKIETYTYHARDDQSRIWNRRKRIENFKEDSERKRQGLEAAKAARKREADEARRREEQERLASEAKEFEKQERERKKQEVLKQIYDDKLNKLRSTAIGRKIIGNISEDKIADNDIDKLYLEQIKEMERNVAEQQEQLGKQEKRWDHLVRAIHLEEIPLRKAEYAAWAPEHRKAWDDYETQRVAREIADHNHREETFQRFQKIRGEAESFLSTVRTERAQEVKDRFAAWEKKVSDERERRLQARRDERKTKRRNDWLVEEKERKEREEREREEDDRRRRVLESQGRRPDDDRRGPGGRRDDEMGESDLIDDWRGARAGPLPDIGGRGGPDRPAGIADDSTDWRRDGGMSNEMQEAREMARQAAGPQRPDDPSDWRAARAGPLAAPDGPPDRMGGPGGPPAREEPDQWRGAGPMQPPEPMRREAPPSEADQGPWRPRGPIEDEAPRRAAAPPESEWRRADRVPEQPPMPVRRAPVEEEREWRRGEGPAQPPPADRNFATNPRFEERGYGGPPERDWGARAGPMAEEPRRPMGGGAYRPPVRDGGQDEGRWARGEGPPQGGPPMRGDPRDMDRGPPPRRGEEGGWQRGQAPGQGGPDGPEEGAEGWNTVDRNRRQPPLSRNTPRDMNSRW